MPFRVRTNSIRQILIVSDDPMVARTRALVLESSGYRAISLFDIHTAPLHLQEHQPDLVIIDLVSEALMQAISLAEHIRIAHPTVRVLLLSDQQSADEAMRELVSRYMPTEIILRPINPKRLLKAIEAQATRAERYDEIVSAKATRRFFKTRGLRHVRYLPA